MQASDPNAALQLNLDGALHCPGAAHSCLPDLFRALDGLPAERAGFRIAANPALAGIVMGHGPIGTLAADAIGRKCRPVRALLFDKTANVNWSLGWHQDRTIVVRDRHDVFGFGPWTIKQGLHHVAPPFALLAKMITLRIHLDPVTDTNAPLRIAPGSHTDLVHADAINAAVQRFGERCCLAEAGDVWIYATAILHASDRANTPAHRRVLQIDYADCDLPKPLEWQGIA